jgi:hypothetical protein
MSVKRWGNELQGQEQGQSFDATKNPVDKFTHEEVEVVRLWTESTDFEQLHLHHNEEMAVYVLAYRNRTVNSLHVRPLDQNLPRLRKKLLHVFFSCHHADLELIDLSGDRD